MKKLRVQRPIVDIDGDEMARVIGEHIRKRLIRPFLDVDLIYFDLGILARDATDDQVTLQAAEAVLKHGVAVKCSTINPDADRQREFGLKRVWRSPNATIRNLLDGTIFREPIICPGVPRLVPHWDQPVIVARHGHGDQYLAQDFRYPAGGRLTIRWTPANGGEPIEREITKTTGEGVALGMFNLISSIEGFARASFTYALRRNVSVYLSTKNTILKEYDGAFKEVFAAIFAQEFRRAFEARGLTYEHRLIDDMVTSSLKWRGGYLWACKNYDGDVQSDAIGQGFGSPGLMTSTLMSPDGRIVVTETAHGTIRRHHQAYLAGEPARSNPLASIYAWARALRCRGEFDATPEVIEFGESLERASLEVVGEGYVTPDLARLADSARPAISTGEFIQRVAVAIERSAPS